MVKLSKSTHDAINNNDVDYLMDLLLVEPASEEAIYLSNACLALAAWMTNDEHIREEHKELLEDVFHSKMRHRGTVQTFLELCSGIYRLDLARFNDSKSSELLGVAILLQSMESLTLTAFKEVDWVPLLEAFPNLTNVSTISGPVLDIWTGEHLPPHVEEVFFEGNGMTNLPRWLSFQHNIRELQCNSNALSEFPEFIPDLIRLRSLNLDDNHIAGRLPDNLGKLVNLTTFYLKNNRFEDLERLEDLPLLASLKIIGNPVIRFPGRLPALVSLTVDADQFHGMRDRIRNSPRLDTLVVIGGSAPVDLAYLQQNTQLTDIFIRDVEIHNLHLIANLPDIEVLRLSNNQLEADLTPIFSLTKLKSLILEENGITELPDLFDQLPALKHLSVTQNSLQALPLSLLRSRVLEEAIIWMNRFPEAYIYAVREQVSFRVRA